MDSQRVAFSCWPHSFRFRVDSSNVETPEPREFSVGIFVVHVSEWRALHPVKSMTMRATALLPLIPSPVIREVEFRLEYDVPEEGKTTVKVSCSDIGVLS